MSDQVRIGVSCNEIQMLKIKENKSVWLMAIATTLLFLCFSPAELEFVVGRSLSFLLQLTICIVYIILISSTLIQLLIRMVRRRSISLSINKNISVLIILAFNIFMLKNHFQAMFLIEYVWNVIRLETAVGNQSLGPMYTCHRKSDLISFLPFSDCGSVIVKGDVNLSKCDTEIAIDPKRTFYHAEYSRRIVNGYYSAWVCISQ